MKRLPKINGKQTTLNYLAGYAAVTKCIRKYGLAFTCELAATHLKDQSIHTEYAKGFIDALQDHKEINEGKLNAR